MLDRHEGFGGEGEGWDEGTRRKVYSIVITPRRKMRTGSLLTLIGLFLLMY
jgi:hypothetical protein